MILLDLFESITCLITQKSHRVHLQTIAQIGAVSDRGDRGRAILPSKSKKNPFEDGQHSQTIVSQMVPIALLVGSEDPEPLSRTAGRGHLSKQ
jgi:hypothetical protein